MSATQAVSTRITYSFFSQQETTTQGNHKKDVHNGKHFVVFSALVFSIISYMKSFEVPPVDGAAPSPLGALPWFGQRLGAGPYRLEDCGLKIGKNRTFWCAPHFVSVGTCVLLFCCAYHSSIYQADGIVGLSTHTQCGSISLSQTSHNFMQIKPTGSIHFFSDWLHGTTAMAAVCGSSSTIFPSWHEVFCIATMGSGG